MLTDSHCHIPMINREVHGSFDNIIANAKKNNVTQFLTVSVELINVNQILSLCEQYQEVYGSVGIHPNTEQTQLTSVDELCHLANHPKIIAIGETGLDYYYSKGDLDWQKERFRTHIQAAKAIGKPLIIHCRDAAEDVLKILREEQASQVGGVMHCFVEDWEVAQQAMDLNFYISFSGIVTFKNAKQVQDVAFRMPYEYLLVETDCPYLAPVPYRGKENQPAYVCYVAEYIAKLKDIDYEVFARQTTTNFNRLFELSTKQDQPISTTNAV